MRKSTKKSKVYDCAHSEYEVGYMDKTLWCNCRESGHRTCDCGIYTYTKQFCPFFQRGELKGKWEISEDELRDAEEYKSKHGIANVKCDAVQDKPLRNCDRPLAHDLLSAVCLYCTEKGIKTPFEEWGTIQHTAFLKWLFAKEDENEQPN